MKIDTKGKIIIICTSMIYYFVILFYELFYCNFRFMAGAINTYNFSLFRVVMYIAIYALCFIYLKKNIEGIEKSFTNKTKQAFTIVLGAVANTILLYLIFGQKQMTLSYVVSVISILLLDLFLIYTTENIAKNAILICITFGIIFSIGITINNQLDEKKHFLSAYSLSFGNLNRVNHTVDKSIAGVKRGLTINEFNRYFSEFPQNDITNSFTAEDACDTPADYFFISYIPPAIGIFLARILRGSIADIYFASRIFNLFAYAILVYIMLKLLPCKKNTFFVTAFFPMLLALSAVNSPDGIVYGTISILIAYCLRLYYQKDKITIKQILILAVLVFLTSIIKGTGYITMSMVVLILPIAQILKDNKKDWWKILLVVLVLILGLAALTYFTTITLKGDVRSVGTNTAEQMKNIIENPIRYLKTLGKHMYNNLINPTVLSYINAPMFFGKTYFIGYIYIMMLLLITGIKDDSKILSRKIIIVFLFTFLITFMATSTAMYLSFTKVGAEYIYGFQPRYLLPMLPLLISCISIKSNKKDNKNHEEDKEEKIRSKKIIEITYILGAVIYISTLGMILKI